MQGCDCSSIIGIQSAVAAASFALCLYTCKKVKMCKCHKKGNDAGLFLPLPQGHIEDLIEQKNEPIEDSDIPKVAITKLQLPKQKTEKNKHEKFTNATSIVELIFILAKESGSIIPHRLLDEIISVSKSEKLKEEQCISSLSYEFVGVYGAEKIQQADVALFTSIMSNVISLEYECYIEFLITLDALDRAILNSFDPMVVLTSLYLISANWDKGECAKPTELSSILKTNNIDASKVASTITVVNIHRRTINVTEEGISKAVDSIRAAVVRRSSRIRKTNK
ncbi:conserved hypothetical protein [Theileria equi strain WA]|uniref:Uncharacterized protein n=1 Tax=Theileria equi strain WA TaxID=1537102 RepID=L1LCG0_THEEQ|nr:conserved hypothetical protein [Theileria equi strain WA]EKX72964.1 conserved hypothetical protein [Theileria equi strain WA]|eukprot:XP_004832416.1 conserved hypothetical protein [Theileria equi strain WA]